MNILVTLINSEQILEAQHLISQDPTLINLIDLNTNLTPLMAVAKKGYYLLGQELLNKGANPTIKGLTGKTAMILATEEGHFELAELLMKYEIFIAEQSPNHSIIQRYSTGFSIQSVYLALPVEFKNYANAALIWAVHLGFLSIVHHALAKNANPNLMISDKSVLMVAAQWGRLEIAQTLLQHGANIDFRDNDGKTALIFAISSKNFELVQFLIQEGADFLEVDRLGHQPINHVHDEDVHIKDFLIQSEHFFKTVVATVRNSDLAELIKISQSIPNFFTQKHLAEKALFVAIQAGKIDAVTYLLDRGVNINAQYNQGRPLTYAGYYEKMDIALYLIERGACINCRDRFSNTIIFYAIASGNVNLVQHLIERGADINIENAGAITPLRQAVMHGYIEIAQLLIQRGANVNYLSRNEGAKTALMDAAWIGFFNIVQLLVESGADISFESYYPERIAAIYAKDASPFLNIQSEHGHIFNYLKEKRLNAETTRLIEPSVKQTDSEPISTLQSAQPDSSSNSNLILRVPAPAHQSTSYSSSSEQVQPSLILRMPAHNNICFTKSSSSSNTSSDARKR